MQTERIIQSDPCNGITINPSDNGGTYTCEISSEVAKMDLPFHVELVPQRMSTDFQIISKKNCFIPSNKLNAVKF